MSRTIPLSRGFVALVDEADYGWLNQWKWYATVRKDSAYAVRNRRLDEQEPGLPYIVYMHRAILGIDGVADFWVDHANGNKLDNRRINLRPCNASLNAANQPKHATTPTVYKGVSWHKASQKWRAYITVKGHTRHLGLFLSPEDAAHAYDVAARAAFGPYALLNLS